MYSQFMMHSQKNIKSCYFLAVRSRCNHTL